MQFWGFGAPKISRVVKTRDESCTVQLRSKEVSPFMCVFLFMYKGYRTFDNHCTIKSLHWENNRSPRVKLTSSDIMSWSTSNFGGFRTALGVFFGAGEWPAAMWWALAGGIAAKQNNAHCTSQGRSHGEPREGCFLRDWSATG